MHITQLLYKTDLRALTAEMAKIKRQSKPIFTNYCLNTPNDAEYEAMLDSGALAFTYNDNDINRICFYGNNEAALINMLSLFQRGSVIDYVSRDSAPFGASLADAGFNCYAVMQRMVNPDLRATFSRNLSRNALDVLCSERVGHATEEDAMQIMRMLYKHLDKNTGHFCHISELITLAKNGNVMCAKENGEISCFFIFKIEGRKLYGYQMYSEKPGESLHSIYYNAISEQIGNGINYAYNWVDSMNKRVIRFHKWYGFELSPLKDYVYVKGR